MLTSLMEMAARIRAVFKRQDLDRDFDEELESHYAMLAQRPGGINAGTDQQFAAGMMWVPGSIAYGIAALIGFYRWLGPETTRSPAQPALERQRKRTSMMIWGQMATTATSRMVHSVARLVFASFAAACPLSVLLFPPLVDFHCI